MSDREGEKRSEGEQLQARWRAIAEESLKGRPLAKLTRESEPGVEVDPLYWGSVDPPEQRRQSDALRPGGSSLCARLDALSIGAHCPSSQYFAPSQVPQVPPQPSSPQVLPSQLGVQSGATHFSLMQR